jgi:hypothetical protein
MSAVTGSERNMSLQEPIDMTQEDREALRRAVRSLEHPSLAARLTNIIGKPVELIGYALPSFASKAISSATSKGLERFVAERGVIKEGAPILLKFVTQVAASFGLVVTQKVAAQALPVVGALGGAAVNYAFLDHFQDVARGHFTVRRLERLYGKEKIRSEYEQIARQL